MTQISLSEAYVIIDEERGKLLARRRKLLDKIKEAEANLYHDDVEKASNEYDECSEQLRLLNRLKKEFARVSNSEQLPLGL